MPGSFCIELSGINLHRGILHTFRHEIFYNAQDENCKQFVNWVENEIVFLKRHQNDTQIVNVTIVRDFIPCNIYHAGNSDTGRETDLWQSNIVIIISMKA